MAALLSGRVTVTAYEIARAHALFDAGGIDQRRAIGHVLQTVTRPYAPDLAYIHHVGFTTFAAAAAPGLLRLLRAHRVRGVVVDLGCGSGLWARVLTDAGYDVLGIDSSPAMIRLARAGAPRARFRRDSLFRASLPPCGAVTAIGECLNYAFDRTAERRRLRLLFARVHAALAPGGVFVFDALAPGQLAPGAVRHVHREGDDWATLVDATEDRRRGVLTRRITAFRRVAGRWRRSREVHRVILYEPAAIRAALVRAGFVVRTRPGYGRALARRHVVFIASKPPTGGASGRRGRAPRG